MPGTFVAFHHALDLSVRGNDYAVALHYRKERFKVKTRARCSRRGMQRALQDHHHPGPGGYGHRGRIGCGCNLRRHSLCKLGLTWRKLFYETIPGWRIVEPGQALG